MTLLLLQLTEDELVVPIGVFREEWSAMIAAQRCFDALLEDARRDELEPAQLTQLEADYWLGFEEVRSPEDVNFTVGHPAGWEYQVAYVEER